MAHSYYEVEVGFKAEADDFDAFLDSVMDELAKIGREVDLTASLARRTASFVAQTEDLTDDSLIALLSDLRTALHAAQCRTADWPSTAQILQAKGVTKTNEGADHLLTA